MYDYDQTRTRNRQFRSEAPQPMTMRGGRSDMPMRQMEGSNVNIYSPTTFEDIQTLIDFLKRNEQVIVDFSSLDQTGAYRIMDFMSGAIYALDGSIKEIKANIFLFAPRGVSISVPPQYRN